jgi:hypothetical protein
MVRGLSRQTSIASSAITPAWSGASTRRTVTSTLR